jgi:hypothetical protein
LVGGRVPLTTNQQVTDWGHVFGDETVAAAVLDRLLHHSHTLVIKGDSYQRLVATGLCPNTRCMPVCIVTAWRVRASASSLVARRSSVVARRSSVVGRRSSVVGRRSSVVGRRSSVVGRRSSVVGRRSSVVGRQRR